MRTLPAILLLVFALVPVTIAFAQDVPAVSEDVAPVVPTADAPAEAATPAVTDEAAVAAAAESVVKPDVISADAVPASSSQSLAGAASGNAEAQTSAKSSAIETDINGRLNLLQPTIDVNLMPSLFFSKWEHDLIVSSRRGTTARPVDAPSDGVGEILSPSGLGSGPREIYLSGIVYVSKKDWVIWLNGLRVTPTAIPSPVMDIKVFKDYIEMDWLDQSTNRIFPIRLRTQQRFNLDTRMFLQGQG